MIEDPLTLSFENKDVLSTKGIGRDAFDHLFDETDLIREKIER